MKDSFFKCNCCQKYRGDISYNSSKQVRNLPFHNDRKNNRTDKETKHQRKGKTQLPLHHHTGVLFLGRYSSFIFLFYFCFFISPASLGSKEVPSSKMSFVLNISSLIGKIISYESTFFFSSLDCVLNKFDRFVPGMLYLLKGMIKITPVTQAFILCFNSV